MVQQGLFHSQQITQRLEQHLAPHQIMSLEILTVPLLDLRTRINQELETNPTLERLESEAEKLVGDPMEDMTTSQSPDSDAAAEAAERDETITGLLQLEGAWDDYVPPSHARQQFNADDEERRQYYFDTLTNDTTLEDDLLEQLRFADIDERLREIAERIIGNIDEMGYFRASLEEIRLNSAQDLRITREEAQDALDLVQSFDPPGIGARNLRESLLLQLKHKGEEHSLAYKIVDKFLEEVSRNHVPQVAKSLNVSTTEIYEAWRHVQQLQPRPGSAVGTDHIQYVLPEVTVEQVDGEYVVTSNRQYLPKVSIVEKYQLLLSNPETPAEIKSYIREKINNGNLLIKSLGQRQTTVQRIAEVLVRRQRDFFDFGKDSLKPLTMSEVADEINVHETTVSRAIANKYMDTPRGMVAMKDFFSGGFKTEDGEMLSSLSIKHKVEQLVAEEDSRKPLSDQTIVEMLKEDGLNVARRTVAKYREELGIPSSHLRRRHAG